MLPKKIESAAAKIEKSGQDLHEEARVYYVGATRVKKKFEHGIAATLADARKLGSGSDREVGLPWSRDKKGKFQIGREGDVAADRAISARIQWCESEGVAIGRQQHLVKLWTTCLDTGTATSVYGGRTGVKVGDEYRYAYRFKAGEETIAWSGDGLVHDLFSVAKAVEKKAGGGKCDLPKSLPHLHMIGLRSVVVSDEAKCAELSPPFSESGFFLSPIIVGFAFFNL